MKKALSILLVLCMVLSICPTTFAEVWICPNCNTEGVGSECPQCGVFDLCTNCGMCYCGYSSEQYETLVTYGVEKSYTVVIPDNVNIPDYQVPGIATIAVVKALLNSRETLSVYITGDSYVSSQAAWMLTSNNHAPELYYHVIANNEQLAHNDLVLSVKAGEAWNSTVSKVLNFELITKPEHAGLYTSALTFVVDITKEGPILDKPYNLYEESIVFKGNGDFIVFAENALGVDTQDERHVVHVGQWEYDAETKCWHDNMGTAGQFNDDFTEFTVMDDDGTSMPEWTYVADGTEHGIYINYQYESLDGVKVLFISEDEALVLRPSYNDGGRATRAAASPSGASTEIHSNVQWEAHYHCGYSSLAEYSVSLTGEHLVMWSDYGEEVFERTNRIEFKPDESEGLVPGIYEPGSIALYQQGQNIDNRLLYSLDALLELEVVYIQDYIIGAKQNPSIAQPKAAAPAPVTSPLLSGDLVLPADGSVRGVASEGFKYQPLTGVYMPDVITEIGYSAFESTQLTIAHLSNQITVIPAYTFNDCLQLSAIRMPTNVQYIDDYAFCGCESLKKIELPEGLLGIGAYAFAWANLQSVVLPSSLESMYDNPFIGTPAVISVTPGGEVFTGDDGCIINAQSGTIVIGNRNGTIADNPVITTIGSNAYSEYSMSTINIPSNIKTIGISAFSDCNKLKTLTIPGTVQIIDNGAFYGCDTLNTVIVQEGVKKIYGSAFAGNPELTTLTLPATLSYCDYSYVVSGCNKLKQITLYGCENIVRNRTFTFLSALETVILPEGVTTIEASAFYGCQNLKNVYLSSTVTSISSLNVSHVYYPGTKSTANTFLANGAWTFGSSTTIHCSDGTICATHDFTDIQDNKCTTCGIDAVMVEYTPSDRAPFNAILGTWNFPEAKSVTILLSYYQPNTYPRETFHLLKGDQFTVGDFNRTSNLSYINEDGEIVFNIAPTWALTTYGTRTITISNVDAVAGAIYYEAYHSNSNYKLKVLVTPNY